MLSPRRHLSVDELSHRSSTGLALRRGEIKISEPVPSSYMHNRLEMAGSQGTYHTTDQTAQHGTWPRGTTATTMAGRSDPGSHGVRTSTFNNLTPPSTREETLTAPSRPSVSMQRRDTGLKASLKRMFSSKRESGDEVEGTQLRRSSAKTPMSRPTKNTVSPLQQHPYDRTAVTAPRSVSQHDLLIHDRPHAVYRDPSDVERRRNTIPDLLMILNDTPAVSQRHAASHDIQGLEDVIAVGDMLEDRLGRRSKSAGALTELLRSSQARLPPEDRAEKIAEWRESIASTSKPQPQIDLEHGIVVAADESLSRRESVEPPRVAPRHNIEVVQEFNFGLRQSNIAPQAGTVEERMNTLEVKMADFEYAIVKMQGSNNPRASAFRFEPATKQKPKPPLQAVRQAEGEEGMPSLSSSCSTKDFSFTSSPLRDGRRKLSEKEEAEQASVVRAAVRAQHARRPSSIKSRNPSPNLATQDSKQYSELIKMLQEERQARSNLELRVIAMQKQLDDLATPIPVLIKPVNQLAPSPELTSHRPLHRSPPLQPQYPFQIETSRFSMNETDTDADGTEDGYHEQFMTPQVDTFRFEHITRAPVGMI